MQVKEEDKRLSSTNLFITLCLIVLEIYFQVDIMIVSYKIFVFKKSKIIMIKKDVQTFLVTMIELIRFQNRTLLLQK